MALERSYMPRTKRTRELLKKQRVKKFQTIRENSLPSGMITDQ